MHYQVIFLSIFFVVLSVQAVQLDFSKPLQPHKREESRKIISSHKKDVSVKSSKSIIIEPAASTYCRVRVALEEFSIGEINQQGYCTGGFSVSGNDNSNNFPNILCGENHGQHAFLNFNGSNPIELYFEDFLDTDYWTITIRQILCTDSSYKDYSCLQYFFGTTGTIKSFNYKSLETLSNPPATYELSELDYLICVDYDSTSYDSITWSRGDSTTNYYFLLSSNSEVIRPSIVGTVEAASFDSNCTSISLSNDYIEITAGTFMNADGEQQTSNIFCGAGFPSFLTSTVTPFRLHVVTNDVEVPREGSVGFSLSYVLN